jgi:hypothetical protein
MLTVLFLQDTLGESSADPQLRPGFVTVSVAPPAIDFSPQLWVILIPLPALFQLLLVAFRFGVTSVVVGFVLVDLNPIVSAHVRLCAGLAFIEAPARHLRMPVKLSEWLHLSAPEANLFVRYHQYQNGISGSSA